MECWHTVIKFLHNFKKHSFFFFFFLNLFFDCVGSSFLCKGFLQLRQAGATLHRGARASHCRGLSCCGAQAPDAQAQQLWLTGLVAPRHVGSSQTRARTHVPCIGRQILNHCATREALKNILKLEENLTREKERTKLSIINKNFIAQSYQPISVNVISFLKNKVKFHYEKLFLISFLQQILFEICGYQLRFDYFI